MRPTGALASLPGKETQVQPGHLFLQETQAKPGHQGRGACVWPSCQCWRTDLLALAASSTRSRRPCSVQAPLEIKDPARSPHLSRGKAQQPRDLSDLYAFKKIQWGKGVRYDGSPLDRVVGTGFSKEGTSGQRSEGRDRASQAASWMRGLCTQGAASAKAQGNLQGME